MGNKESAKLKQQGESLEDLKKEVETLNTELRKLGGKLFTALNLNDTFTGLGDNTVPLIVVDTKGDVVSNNTRWFSKPEIAKFLSGNSTGQIPAGPYAPAFFNSGNAPTLKNPLITQTDLSSLLSSSLPKRVKLGTTALTCGGGITCVIAPEGVSWDSITENGITTLNGTVSFTYFGTANPPFAFSSFPIHFKNIFSANGFMNRGFAPEYGGVVTFFNTSFNGFAVFFPPASSNNDNFDWGAPGKSINVILSVTIEGIV
jgi:hypothetical protein